jgi:hypothetical protein
LCHSVGAGRRGPAQRAVDEARIAQRLQQHALRVGEDDHAVVVARLIEQVFHHRPCMRDQFALVLQRAHELRRRGVRRAEHASGGGQAELPAAVPAALQAGLDQAAAELAVLEQLAACFAQACGRGAGGKGMVVHRVSWGASDEPWRDFNARIEPSVVRGRRKRFNRFAGIDCPAS